ncbi:MAG: hypothetical protein H0T92_15305 [Pyrinomonadaceae bacterium]|nr:hypothetical protein [Pyrinomonadaceae bacterium]
MVKYLSAFLLSLTLTGLSQAQVAPAGGGESGLQVVRFGWAKYRPSRLSLDTGLPRADTGPAERAEDMRLERQIAVERRLGSRSKDYPVESLEELKARRQRRLPEPGRTRPTGAAGGVGYRYSVELENAGAKKVKIVEWDYLFVEPGTNKELLSRSFTSKVGIDSGKRKKVTVETDSAPYGVVDVRVMSGGASGEKVVIKRVVYADGSVWER